MNDNGGSARVVCLATAGGGSVEFEFFFGSRITHWPHCLFPAGHPFFTSSRLLQGVGASLESEGGHWDWSLSLKFLSPWRVRRDMGRSVPRGKVPALSLPQRL